MSLIFLWNMTRPPQQKDDDIRAVETEAKTSQSNPGGWMADWMNRRMGHYLQFASQE